MSYCVIKGPQAWDVRTNAQWIAGTTTNPVIVAVIDTGMLYTHEDLAPNLWTNAGEIPGNSLDDDNDGYIDDVHGIDAYANTSDPLDTQGHGTHCSGVVGGAGNNGKGIVGVCWGVQLMPLKFFAPNGNGADSDAIECIEYAIAHGAHILSNSWGG